MGYCIQLHWEPKHCGMMLGLSCVNEVKAGKWWIGLGATLRSTVMFTRYINIARYNIQNQTGSTEADFSSKPTAALSHHVWWLRWYVTQNIRAPISIVCHLQPPQTPRGILIWGTHHVFCACRGEHLPMQWSKHDETARSAVAFIQTGEYFWVTRQWWRRSCDASPTWLYVLANDLPVFHLVLVIGGYNISIPFC